ncbi:MAG: redoxin domain-containing protein [Chloroflexi bacterium]|nr:redoxin domain-containing protein [Chloroflexota bacterium]
MNRLKAIFISAFVAMGIIVSVIAIGQLILDGFSLTWVGCLIAVLPGVIYFGNNYRYKIPRTSEKMTPVTLPIAFGAALAFVGTVFLVEPVVPAIIAVGMYLLWLIYLGWYSRFDVPATPSLTVGQQFPDLKFKDEKRTAVLTSTFIGQKVLYLFYRGNWCPFCMSQVREIAAQYHELDRRGVRVALISPQPHKLTAELAAKFQVPMMFLVDEKNQAARKLGIANEYGVPAGMEMFGYEPETVLPTVILVDENSKILYANQTDNYRIRPEPAEFLRVLDRIAE